MSHSSEIIKHYADKNLPWAEFKRAIERHVRLLEPLDYAASVDLSLTPLRAPTLLRMPAAKKEKPVSLLALRAQKKAAERVRLERDREKSRCWMRGYRAAMRKQQQAGT